MKKEKSITGDKLLRKYLLQDKEVYKSQVNIRKVGGGYLIEVEDESIKKSFAITRTELEKIVLYGQKILEDK